MLGYISVRKLLVDTLEYKKYFEGRKAKEYLERRRHSRIYII